MPILTKSQEVLNQMVNFETAAKEFGFYWTDMEQILEQIHSECDEVKEAALELDKTHLKEEVGDVINAAISLCIFLQLDPLETMQENVDKFQKRYDTLVSLVKKDGLKDLKNQPLEVQMSYWRKAKGIK